MENNKIYTRVKDRFIQSYSRLLSKGKCSEAQGVYAYKEATFRLRYGNEFDTTSGCYTISSNKTSTSGNLDNSKRRNNKRVLGQVTMEVHSSLSDNCASGELQAEKLAGGTDEFGSLFRGRINIEEVDWEACDTNPKLQSKLYNVLDRGIIKIVNIPKIPIEYEPKGMDYYGLDSEDNGMGVPHFYQFATRDTVYIAASFKLLFRYITQILTLNSRNHVVWGTNIEYDLGNILKDWDVKKESCDLKWTKGGLKKFELFYSPEFLSWADKEDQTGMIKVWDTLNHWRMGVKDIGKNITEQIGYDFNKLPQDFYGLKYSAMDAILSRSYACIQKKYYDDKGIPLKFTPGATALGYYMKGHTPSGDLFCKHKLFGTHAEEDLKWLIEGLRGGRTEVFSLKEYSGKIGYYDINSAYPFSMKYGVFPHPASHMWVTGHKQIQKMIDEGYEGMIDCLVEISPVTESFVSIIPYLGTIQPKTGRYIFPLGKWQGKYTVFEIKKAQALGYNFKFIKGLLYEPSIYQPFSEFVDFCYTIRDEGTAKGDKILRDIGKSLGNNLYGKFGQRLRFTELDNPDNFRAEDIGDCIRIGDGVLIEKDEGFAPHSNVIWSVYITAICRDLLYNHMLNAHAAGNEVLYCDTDSIFVHGGSRPESHQTKLGALKHEGDLSYFKAILPKTYIYEAHEKRCYKAKGVPEDQKKTFLTHGIVEYKKPMKIREAMRRKIFDPKDADKKLKTGITSVNAWITVHKELKGKYTKRIINKDNSTSPIILT